MVHIDIEKVPFKLWPWTMHLRSKHLQEAVKAGVWATQSTERQYELKRDFF
jgi:hypothetical protein